jgi:hypothetical protein
MTMTMMMNHVVVFAAVAVLETLGIPPGLETTTTTTTPMAVDRSSVSAADCFCS